MHIQAVLVEVHTRVGFRLVVFDIVIVIERLHPQIKLFPFVGGDRIPVTTIVLHQSESGFNGRGDGVQLCHALNKY